MTAAPFNNAIEPADAACARLAAERQDQLIKPRGALGRLEELACWFAARQRRAVPRRLTPAIVVFAADHHVTTHGVSAYPASVTRQMLDALARGGAAINVLARSIDASLTIVDVGVDAESPPPPGVRNERIARGALDLVSGPAMTAEQTHRALDVGARYARDAIARGCDLLIAGEIGIGNTTPAACLIAKLANAHPEDVVGAGSGLTPAQRAHKVAVVRRALARVGSTCDARQLLAQLGGFEIAAMTGFYLEAARQSAPCLLDGFISTAAALTAHAIDPSVREWMLASHVSPERGHARALETLALAPLLDCGMRLGEGSGAAVATPLLQAAIRLHAEMLTFSEAGVASS
jgi:nicotinate-nucleotide--dimethylbenzimidazole phosphoribosyltransferase